MYQVIKITSFWSGKMWGQDLRAEGPCYPLVSTSWGHDQGRLHVDDSVDPVTAFGHRVLISALFITLLCQELGRWLLWI